MQYNRDVDIDVDVDVDIGVVISIDIVIDVVIFIDFDSDTNSNIGHRRKMRKNRRLSVGQQPALGSVQYVGIFVGGGRRGSRTRVPHAALRRWRRRRRRRRRRIGGEGVEMGGRFRPC